MLTKYEKQTQTMYSFEKQEMFEKHKCPPVAKFKRVGYRQ